MLKQAVDKKNPRLNLQKKCCAYKVCIFSTWMCWVDIEISIDFDNSQQTSC